MRCLGFRRSHRFQPKPNVSIEQIDQANEQSFIIEDKGHHAKPLVSINSEMRVLQGRSRFGTPVKPHKGVACLIR
jgi:hypothetical protein